MDRGPPSLERKSVDSFFQYLKKQLPHRHGSSSTRKLFAVAKLEFIEEIGTGGYGRVWAAKYLGDVVAVKELYSFNRTGDASSSESRRVEEELAKEAEILEQKRSKRIVNLIHYSPEKNMLVMEHCQNGSLARVMRSEDERHIVLEWKNRLKWVWQIAQGMNVMHNQGHSVLHRDLKPPNLFLTECYNIKIGDVGLSKQLLTDLGIESSRSMDTHYTVWQPPEVISGRRYSRKSDVYSFGVIMHQLLMIDEPYGFDLPPQELNAKVYVHVTDGKGLDVPEDRALIPGKWHPCLEKYTDLMYKCCATPEDRPEFDEICETLAEVQEEYKKARMVESLRERITAESLKRAFVVSALVALCLLSVSALLDHSRPGWSVEVSAFNRQRLFMELICVLFGLFCVFGSVVCVAWQRRRGTYNFFEKRVFKPMQSSFRNVIEWFEDWNLNQEDQNLPVKSPFEVGPSFLGPGGLASGSDVAPLPIPDLETWKQISAAFISELQGNAYTGLETILRFCQEHENEQLDQSEWEDFVGLFSRESQVTNTDAWRRYQNHLTVPYFFTQQGVFSSQDNMSCLDGDHPSSWAMDQVSSPRFETDISALHSKEFYFAQLFRSVSFPIDRCGQLETEQLSDSDLLPRSFSLGVPTVRSEASGT